MVAKLKSVLRNQILRLAFKAFVLISLIFSYEYSHSFLYLSLFVLALSVFYLYPAVGNGKYKIPILASLFLVVALPTGLESDLYTYFSIVIGSILALIIGLKNLMFIDKAKIYAFISLTLASIFIVFPFWGFLEYFPGASSLILFGAMFLIFRDLYKIDLAAGVMGLVVVEFSWALSVLPLGVAIKAIIQIAITIALHNLYIRYSRHASA